jgi:hypothetical protein
MATGDTGARGPLTMRFVILSPSRYANRLSSSGTGLPVPDGAHHGVADNVVNKKMTTLS